VAVFCEYGFESCTVALVLPESTIHLTTITVDTITQLRQTHLFHFLACFDSAEPSTGRRINISGNYSSYEALISLSQLTFYYLTDAYWPYIFYLCEYNYRKYAQKCV
jgi:hypothetical protein